MRTRDIEVIVTRYKEVGGVTTTSESVHRVHAAPLQLMIQMGDNEHGSRDGSGEMLVKMQPDDRRRRSGRECVELLFSERGIELFGRTKGVTKRRDGLQKDVVYMRLPIRKMPHSAYFLLGDEKKISADRVFGFDISARRV